MQVRTWGWARHTLRVQPEGARFAKAFDEASERIVWHYLDIFWKVRRVLRICSEVALTKNIQVIDGFLYKLINSKVDQISSAPQDDSMKKAADRLSRFLAEGLRDHKKKLSNKYLRDITLKFILAGKDATAGTLSWLFCMLCKHPDHVQEKVAREVNEVTEAGCGLSTAETSAAKMTEEILEGMLS